MLDPAENYAGSGFNFSQFQKLPPVKKGRILVDSIEQLQQVVAYHRQQLRDAESELFSLADEIGASVIDGTRTEALVDLEGDYIWEYDVEVLSELQAYLEPEQFERAMEPVPATFKVKKVELNKLAKRGGKIADIIDNGCTKVPKGGRKITLRPRKI